MNIKKLYINGIMIILFLTIIIKPFSVMAESTDVLSNSETIIEYESSWNIMASSIHVSRDILKAFDGNLNTYWHSKYSEDGGDNINHDEPPFEITVIFPEEKLISGWLYTPRTDNGTGTILAYNIYASTDGSTYEKIYTGDFDYSLNASDKHEPKGASWGNVKMKAIKIEIADSLYGYGTAAEINFYTETPFYLFDYENENIGTCISYVDNSNKKFVRLNIYNEYLDKYKIFSASYDEYDNELIDIKLYNTCDEDFDITTNKLIIFSINDIKPIKYTVTTYKHDTSKGTILGNSEMWWGTLPDAFDNINYSFWHSYYTTDGQNILSQDVEPFIIDYKFNQSEIINKISILLRNENAVGIIKKGKIYLKLNDAIQTVINIDNPDLLINLNYNINNIKADEFLIIITESEGHFGVIKEITIN